LASYVLKMYMANEGCAKWMGGMLNSGGGGGGGNGGGSGGGGLRAVLVVSRDENLEAASRVMREVGGIRVLQLMVGWCRLTLWNPI